MKKLMFALAAVAMVASANAAATIWKANAGSTGVLYGPDTAHSVMADQTVYLICADAITQANLVKAYADANGSINLANYAVSTTEGAGTVATATTTSAGKLTGDGHTFAFTNDGDFTDGSKYNFYLATIASDGSLYVSDSTSGTATESTTGATIGSFKAIKDSSKLGPSDAKAGYTAAGWYNVPEPTSGLLLLLGVAGLALRRRRA